MHFLYVSFFHAHEIVVHFYFFVGIYLRRFPTFYLWSIISLTFVMGNVPLVYKYIYITLQTKAKHRHAIHYLCRRF